MTELSFSVPEAVRITSLGRSTIYEAMKTGQLKARKCGKRTVILESDLSAFLKALPALGEARAA